MKIIVAGAHGQIAMLLHPLLVSNGHEVRGIIRNPDHADDLVRAGAQPVLCDIEKVTDLSDAVGDADAVVFAAGAGPGSGAARKVTVDRDGAIKLIEACHKRGIRRYVMISAMRLDEPRGDEVFRAYLKAKSEAEQALRESGLDYTILRPGRLTDDLPSGRVALGRDLPSDEISRADVAEMIAEVLEWPECIGQEWDLTRGNERYDAAIRKATGMPDAPPDFY